MTEDAGFGFGAALIMEGATEEVFYSEFIRHLVAVHGASISRLENDGSSGSVLTRPDGISALIMMDRVGTVTQMVNSGIWFERACAGRYQIPWFVFLCYDTDEYCSNVTKFHEGDWARLHNQIGAQARQVIDLAASADIEDIMLCDYPGVLRFLGLPEDTALPPGRKGKARMKRLFHMVALNRPYHEGQKALPLIRSLDMEAIKAAAPVPFKELEETLFGGSWNENGQSPLAQCWYQVASISPRAI